MIIQFSPAELDGLTIQPVAHPPPPAAYLEEREAAWRAQMAKVVARGGSMWNGEIYTLDDIVLPDDGQVVFRMGTCEFKDVVFRHAKGRGYITRQHGEQYLYRFTGVTVIPVTQDGRFVFGIRGDQPEKGRPLGCIGGSLNKDEMEIHTFADIRQCAHRELGEETMLACPLEALRFCGLCAMPYTYLFLFTARVPLHSREVAGCNRPGEFASLVALTQQEALNQPEPMTPAFRRLRSCLDLLQEPR